MLILVNTSLSTPPRPPITLYRHVTPLDRQTYHQHHRQAHSANGERIAEFSEQYEHGKTRFSSWQDNDYSSTMPNRVGFYRADNDSYYIYSPLFEKEICLPFNKKQVCETLNSMDLLIKNKNYQLFVKSTDRDKKGYFYCIKGDILTIEN